jgi:hypothetical protein
MAKAKTFCVRRRDADPQSTDGVQLINGTRSQVESYVIGQHLIEPASDLELNELGALGVKISSAVESEPIPFPTAAE